MDPTTAVVHIPFRCPDCGDSIKFDTLKELRHHLQTEHADIYAIPVKESRPTSPPSHNIFSARSSTPIMDLYHADAIRIEEDLRNSKRNELNNKHRRMEKFSSSRIPRSNVGYSRSTIQRVNGSPDYKPSTFRNYGHSSRLEYKYSNRANADAISKFIEHEHSNRISQRENLDQSFRDDESLQDVTKPTYIPRQINKIHNISPSKTQAKKTSNAKIPSFKSPVSVSPEMDNHVKEALTALSQEVILSRAGQHATADSLIASQEIYSSLEQSAQDRISQQQEIIATLALKLSEKDEKLADLTVKVNSLKSQTNEDEIKNSLRNKYNEESEKLLQEELVYKQKELLSLSERVDNAKLAVLKCEKEIKDNKELELSAKEKKDYEHSFDVIEKPERDVNNRFNYNDDKQSKVGLHQDKMHKVEEKDMLDKEKELVSLRSKSIQLESDRQTLLLEMQALLEIAAKDNEKLRAELADQGKQLSKLNLELERSKQDQSELLGETNTLYFQADVSLSRLKHVLEERDSQLSSVSAQLEQARNMQERLTKEREEYLKAAIEKEANYQFLVEENAVQLKTMRESLDDSQVEKEKLQEKLKSLKGELDRKEKEDLQMENRMKEMETQLADHETWQISMRNQIKNKEDRLQNAKRSMDQMNDFMSDTAKKELEARSRLEQFISNLIDKSTQTESELKKLREAYAAKEEVLKNVMEAHSKMDARQNNSSWDKHPSWQQEAQEQIKKLSSSPLKDSNTLPDLYNAKQQYPQSASHDIQPQGASFDFESEYEILDASRQRSSINDVKKNNTMGTVPERQIKNRPLLVLGKEYPHPSAYGSKKDDAQGSRNRVNYNNKQRNPPRGSLHEDKFYLPVENDEYGNRPYAQNNSQNQPRNRGSSPAKSYSQSKYRNNPAKGPHNNHPLFKNTPEVDRMYQNLQKQTFSARGGKARQLPMDDQGIIWEPNRFSPKTRPVKKKVRDQSHPRLSKRENVCKGHKSDSEEQQRGFDSDEELFIPNKRNEQRKGNSYPISQNPTPLGDKIAVLLTSMAPASSSSSARQEYAQTSKDRHSKNKTESKNTHTESDSEAPQSNPLQSARAVQQRVEKLTAKKNEETSEKVNDLKTSPVEATPVLIDQSDEVKDRQKNIQEVDEEKTDIKSTYSSNLIWLTKSQELHYNSGSQGHTAEKIEDRKEETTHQPKDSFPTIDVADSHSKTDLKLDQEERAKFSMTKYETDGASHKNSLLHPGQDDCEPLYSHNAESDFSSSSYTTLRNEGVPDLTVDTQEEETTTKPNERQVFAQVHTELTNRVSFESNKKENSDEENPEGSSSVSKIRAQFQKMSSRDSFSRSKSSDSNRTVFPRQDSQGKSASYDEVMKELIEKHPYIEKQPKDTIEASPRSGVKSHYDNNMRRKSSDKELSSPTRMPYQDDSSDHGLMSSEDEGKSERRMSSNSPRKMSRGDTVDASTDTDLEKLAMPGAFHKPLGGKKKKKSSALIKKDRNKRQKQAFRLKDVANTEWASVDSNDPEEREREERILRRRLRVALFCALAYADTKTLLNTSQVCKDWRKISHHPSLWKHVVLKDSKISSEFLITLSQWCTKTETLSLQGLKGRSQKLMESEEDYHKTTRGCLEPGLERLLFACQGSLKSLTIEGCENVLTDKCLWMVSSNCRMLTHLSYRSRMDPINAQLMWALGGGCPGVTSLYVHPYHDSIATSGMNNRCLLQIGQFYRDLKEVGLGGMEFNMAGLLPFIQCCQHLTSIHMDSCMPVTDDLATAMCRAGLKDLHTFIITNTAFQAKAVQTLQANCRLLKKIQITVTPQSCGLDLEKKKEKEEYKKLIKGYKDLKKKAGLSHILTLDIQELE